MRRFLGILILASFAGAAAALVLVSAVSYRSLRSLEQDTALRSATSLTLLSLGDLLVHLVDAETGQRGYLLTGEPTYLEPYRESVTRIGDDRVALRKFLRADSLLERALGRLGPLLTAKLAVLDTTIALQRAGRTQAARQIVLGGRGKDLMDRIRQEIRSTQDTGLAEWDIRLPAGEGLSTAYA